MESTIPASTSLINSDIGENKNFMIVILSILLIFSLLGVNLLLIFGNLIQVIVNVFKPLVYNLLGIFGYVSGSVINKTADVTSDVARAGINIAEGAIQSAGNLLKDASKNAVNYETKKELDFSLNEPSFDTTESPIQTNISSNKSNWCLIGEYNGRKGCVEVDDDDKCLSKKIFKTKELCLNPTFTSNMVPTKKPHPLKSIATQ